MGLISIIFFEPSKEKIMLYFSYALTNRKAMLVEWFLTCFVMGEVMSSFPLAFKNIKIFLK